MYNLSEFRNRVRELCRQGTPYDDDRRPSLADLASAIGLSRGELSYRLNGTNNARLTIQDVRAIVRTLTEWGALTTRSEATELMALVECPPPLAAEWEVPPLNQLTTPSIHAPAPAISSISRTPRVEQRVGIVRPPAHQPEISRIAIGRATELAQLDALLENHTCIAITGVGGMGKSTFTAMYLSAAPYTSTCWRNLHHNPGFADFTQAAISSLGLYFDPATMPRPQDQANYLASVLRGNSDIRQLIVLNNFESVIGADEVEAGWQELLELAIAGLGESRVLLTTRDLPYTRQGREPYRYPLGGLSEADGVALLERLGVSATPAELTQAVKLAGGHPLALVFFADLSHNHGYSVADLLMETAWSEHVAERFLDKIYRQLPANAQAVLNYFSVFDAPAEAEAVAGMLAHLPDPAAAWSKAQVQRAAAQLTDRSLLEARAGYYQLHPIIREYAHKRLADAPNYHRAAADYFQSIYTHNPYDNPPRNLSDVQPLLDAIAHLCAAGDYEAAFDVFIAGREHASGKWFRHLSMLMTSWGEYMRVAAICQPLANAPADHLSSEKRSVAINNLGIIYYSLGQYDEAIAWFNRGLELTSQEDVRNKLNLLANLGLVYQKMKDYDRAIEYNEQVISLASESGYLPPQSTALSNMGDIYTGQGDYERALATHLRCYAISMEMNDESGISTDLLNIGESYFYLGQVEQALQHYEEGLALAEKINHPNLQGWAWQRLGMLFQHLKRAEDALACYLKALTIRERLGHPDEIEENRECITSLRNTIPAHEWNELEVAATSLATNEDWRPDNNYAQEQA